MKVQDVKEIAQRMNIAPGKMKKGELIRAIQKTEGNDECFATGRSSQCGRHDCLWMGDCD